MGMMTVQTEKMNTIAMKLDALTISSPVPMADAFHLSGAVTMTMIAATNQMSLQNAGT
jgi:hypothetical protein